MSDLSAFTIYKANAGMLAVLDITNPILGSGSLKINRNGTTGRFVNMVRATAPNSFTSGRARFLLDSTADSAADAIGFVFQQSQTDLTGGVGAAYGLYVQMTNSVTDTWTPLLYKFTAGLGTGTTLATGTSYVAAPGTETAYEVEWILDVANLGGLQVKVKRGTASAYTNLVADAALNIIITSSVLTVSVGEGPFYVGDPNSTGFYLYDHFEVVPLIVG